MKHQSRSTPTSSIGIAHASFSAIHSHPTSSRLSKSGSSLITVAKSLHNANVKELHFIGSDAAISANEEILPRCVDWLLCELRRFSSSLFILCFTVQSSTKLPPGYKLDRDVTCATVLIANKISTQSSVLCKSSSIRSWPI